MSDSLAVAYALKKRKKMNHGGYCNEGCMVEHEHKYADGGEIVRKETPFAKSMREAFQGPSPKAETPQDGEPKKKETPFAKGFRESFGLPSYADGGEVKKDNPFTAEDESYENDFGYMPKQARGILNHASQNPEKVAQAMNAVGGASMAMARGGFAHEDEDEDADIVGRIIKDRAMHLSRGGKVANATPVHADFEENEFDDLVKDDDLEFHETAKNSGDEDGDEAEEHDRRDIVKRIMKSRHKKDRMPHPA